MPFPDEAFTKRGVEVSAYRGTWGDEAATYLGLLQERVPGALSVDHIGSTSVPGLPAKDCLDLMVQVDALDEDAVTTAMASHGFRMRPEPWNHDEVTEGVSYRKLVFAGPPGGRAVNVHVRVAGGRNVRYALLFRDFLRADDAARDAWGEFKTRLAASVTDLMEYGQIKATAQPLLMRAAESWATRTGWTVALATRSDGPSVLGVDGCRAGWVGVLVAGTTAEALVAPAIKDLVETARTRQPDLAVVAVDIPIGLPDRGRRRADLQARRRLPAGRKSSVFPTPTRATALESTYAGATDASRATTDGKGISRQTFMIVPKILEVDGYVRSGPPVPVVEAHPEVSFAEIDPACVLPGKTTVDGAASRLQALRSVGLEPPAYDRGRGYATDDLLDACVVAFTAARYAAGTAYSLPDPPEVFSDGIPAAIWV
ncbi:MAG TPA: DUF429 domain-containing protein [Nocardioides sp.]|uniref:DUF429 domain-containing protein n=1 Tax=Nocardioides sp. TaxID=35761 RepID=UPI002F40E456